MADLDELAAAEEQARKGAIDTIDFTYAPVDPTAPLRAYAAAVEARVREQVQAELTAERAVIEAARGWGCEQMPTWCFSCATARPCDGDDCRAALAALDAAAPGQEAP